MLRQALVVLVLKTLLITVVSPRYSSLSACLVPHALDELTVTFEIDLRDFSQLPSYQPSPVDAILRRGRKRCPQVTNAPFSCRLIYQ